MANLATFGDLKTRVATRVGASRAADVTRIGEYCLEACREVWRRFSWPERRRRVVLVTKAPGTVTLTVTNNNAAATVTAGSVAIGDKLVVAWGDAPYVAKNVSGANVTLDRVYLGTSGSQVFVTFQDELDLPADAAEVLTEDIQILDGSGPPIEWKDRITGAWEYAYPRSSGRPLWMTYGDNKLDPSTGLMTGARVRVGPSAPDQAYALRLGYLNVYPTPAGDGDALLIPQDRRDLAVWAALYRAYTEPPWLSEVNAGQMKGLYEAQLDIALRTQKEGTADIFVIDRMDEGAFW